MGKSIRVVIHGGASILERPSSEVHVSTQIVNEDAALLSPLKIFSERGVQHFSGFHLPLLTCALPTNAVVAFYPALYPEEKIDEKVGSLNIEDTKESVLSAGLTAEI